MHRPAWAFAKESRSRSSSYKAHFWTALFLPPPPIPPSHSCESAGLLHPTARQAARHDPSAGHGRLRRSEGAALQTGGRGPTPASRAGRVLALPALCGVRQRPLPTTAWRASVRHGPPPHTARGRAIATRARVQCMRAGAARAHAPSRFRPPPPGPPPPRAAPCRAHSTATTWAGGATNV